MAQLQALIAGTQKHLPNGSFTIGSTTYTAASLIQVLETLVTAMTARIAAATGAKDALVTEQATQTKVGPVAQAYKNLVLAAFANASQTLSDFGLAPPKGANADVRRAAGGKGGEGRGHAQSAWDYEQEAEARSHWQCDGRHRDPRHRAGRSPAACTAGVDCFERAHSAGPVHEVAGTS